eukprot:GAHX01001422.1.p1 GENE.GAHX01001422.1~~GAHX01001422.1.p1  ORF type:complete len:202 (-),score=39.18 GAHX01001422.1:31-636(-)
MFRLFTATVIFLNFVARCSVIVSYAPQENRCFFESVLLGTLTSINIDTLKGSKDPILTKEIKVTITDENENVLFKDADIPFKHKYTPKSEGWLHVCIENSGNNNTMVEIGIRNNYNFEDFNQVDTKETLSNTTGKINHIKEQIDTLFQAIKYSQDKEENARYRYDMIMLKISFFTLALVCVLAIVKYNTHKDIMKVFKKLY